MTRKMFAFLASGLIVALVAAACGGNDGDTDSGADGDPPVLVGGDDDDGSVDDNGGDFSGAVNPCELLTEDEVSAALGEQAIVGEPEDFDPFFSCVFETETLNTVGVSLYTDERENVEEYLELGNEESEVIEGVGEKAYWSEAFGDLEVLAGEYYIAVSVSSTEPEVDELEAAKTLAQAAIERLP